MTIPYDVCNHELLNVGYQAAADQTTWRPMADAPRDGTIVEIKSNYGVAPHYGLYRWTTEDYVIHHNGNTGEQTRELMTREKPAWRYADGRGGGPFSEDHLTWRPTDQQPAAYVDPTSGAQNSMAYWRGAAARRSGLAPDAFEAETARNLKKSHEPRSWWRRFLGGCH